LTAISPRRWRRRNARTSGNPSDRTVYLCRPAARETGVHAAAKARLAWIWDLSERRVLEPVDEQCLLAEDFDSRVGGREPTGQDEQQAGAGPADGDVGFAVAAGDGDAGRCPCHQPLAGAGQSWV